MDAAVQRSADEMDAVLRCDAGHEALETITRLMLGHTLLRKNSLMALDSLVVICPYQLNGRTES